jgi:hypothetical protein
MPRRAQRPVAGRARAGGAAVQRDEQEAITLAGQLSGRTYTNIDELVRDKQRFGNDDWQRIVAAYNRGDTGPRLRFLAPHEDEVAQEPEIRDRSGARVRSEPLNKQELPKLMEVKTQLRKTPAYEDMLVFLEARVRERLGIVGFQQLYRGGHIVLNDGGDVYRELQRRWGRLGSPRLTTKRQTSHYTASDGYDVSIEATTPQIGVDLPSPLAGHILYGIVPPRTKNDDSGDTFVQTEMFGFQNFWNTYVGHGKGYITSVTGYGNSGLVGYSPYSEKQGKEIREVDNL